VNAELRSLLELDLTARQRIARTLAALPRPRLPRITWRPSPDLGADAAFICGLAAVAAGFGWIFEPLAPIIGGGFLAAVGWWCGRPDDEPPAAEARSETWFSDGGAQHPVDEED
jgi:hypothetical protein